MTAEGKIIFDLIFTAIHTTYKSARLYTLKSAFSGCAF